MKINKLINSGSSAYTCWAFSCASMLRTSVKLFIRRCHEIGLINEDKMNKLLDYINEEKVHVELRNLIMMILLPKKLHIDDSSQAAFLRAAVSRVNHDNELKFLILNLDRQSNRDGAAGTRFFAANLVLDANSNTRPLYRTLNSK